MGRLFLKAGPALLSSPKAPFVVKPKVFQWWGWGRILWRLDMEFK